jgi:LexA-binding, inner membrane-associated putative hydrolase
MFIGHFAVAFATKKVAPRASLGTLVLAAAFLDLVWPVLVLLGIERFRIIPGFTAVNPFDFTYYPWSHSLLMTVLWSVAFALGYFAFSRDRTGAVWVGIVVASHWVLDFVSHRPDMPLYPGGGQKLGLSLWQSIPATFAVEGLMFAAGIAIYVRATRSRDRTGALAWWAMVGLLLALYVPGPWASPPPSANSVAVLGIIALAIFGPWAYWIDRHRAPA